MVGIAGLEELSRPMAVGRIRGILGKLYVQYRQNQKEFFNAISEGQELLNTGDIKAINRFTGTHLDGQRHSVVRGRVPALTGFDLLEGGLRAANVARAIGGSRNQDSDIVQGYV